MVTIESVQQSLRTAENWQNKGQTTWVSKCLSSALMGYLQLALTEHNDPVSGVAWLADQKFASVLQCQIDTLQILGDEVTAGRLPPSAVAGNYHPLVFAHAAWGLKRIELGESFVAFAQREDVGDLSTHFWREYAVGMAALVRGEVYRANELRPRGQEKYWMAYVRLIEAACNAQPIEGALYEIDKLFATRNVDKTIKDDAYQIEGSGGQPANWDFRRCGLTNYLEHRQCHPPAGS